MIDQGKNLIIGMFVIAACMVVVISLVFLHPKVGDNGHTLRVLFTDVDKITKGTRVTFAGMPVGEVVELREIPDARDHRKAHAGDVYVYEVIMKIDSGVNIFNSDSVSARTSGLLGEKNIVIDPIPPKPGEPLRLVNNEILYAEQPANVEDTMKEVAALAVTFRDTLELAKDALSKLKNENLWENISTASENIAEITSALNKPKELEEIIDDIRLFTSKLPDAWESVNASLANVKDATGNAKRSTEDFLVISNDGKNVMDKVARGEGSLGHLLVGNDVYLQVRSLLSGGQRIMDDVGQYGVLFQNNKKWQRINARRADLTSKLRDTEEFQRYFNNEIDQISSSLSDVSMVLRECERQPYYMENLSANPEYAERFAELLMRTKNVEECLNMYNTQAVDNRD